MKIELVSNTLWLTIGSSVHDLVSLKLLSDVDCLQSSGSNVQILVSKVEIDSTPKLLLLHNLNSITRSYKSNLHRALIKHDTLKRQNTIKKVNVVDQILKYEGYAKPPLTMYVLNNLHGQLSQ